MRIGADGSHLRWRRTGIARYLDCVLHAMAARLGSDDEMVVYYNSRPGEAMFSPPVRERFVRLPTAVLWNQVAVPVATRADGCDVYLGGANVIPVARKRPSVVVVHDCMSFRFPSSKSKWVAAYHRRTTRASARRAAAVVCDSQWGADDAVHYLGITRDKIRVVPLAVDATFRPAAPDARPAILADLEQRHGIRAPFVLQVGGFELHKGGATAVAAVDELRTRGHAVTLVRCGIPGHGATAASSAGDVDLGFVEEELLHALYRTAAVVCVASTHEGFGLPVLEAMASGTPVVAARASSLPEVGGDVAVYAEPNDVRSFADAIERLLIDSDDADRRRRAGLAHAATFTWERTADQMLDVVREAAA